MVNGTTRGMATTRFIAGLLFAWLVLSSGIVTIRVSSVVHARGALSCTGLEGMATYGIWKNVNGLPIYEDPFSWPYPSSLFNVAFYGIYGRINHLLGFNQSAILLPARMITLAFGVLGTIGMLWGLAQLADEQDDVGTKRIVRLLSLTVGLTAFLGSNFTSWWLLAIRPDVAAGAMVAWGWAFLLKGERRNNAVWFILSAIMFFAAWCFKQSFVVTALAVGIYLLLVERNLRRTFMFAGIYAGLMAIAAAILLPIPHYVQNTLVAPAGNPFSASIAASVFGTAILQDAFVLLFPAVAGAIALRESFSLAKTEPIPGTSSQLPLFVYGLLAFAGILACGRLGGSRNYLFEWHLAACIATVSMLRRCLQARRAGSGKASTTCAVLLLLPTVLFPATQLALPNRVGRIYFTGREIADARDLTRFISAHASSILVFEDSWAAPWYTTNGRYPAMVLDELVFSSASRRGLIRDRDWQSQFARRRVSVILARAGTDPYQAALAAGYIDNPEEVVNRFGLRYLTLGPLYKVKRVD